MAIQTIKGFTPDEFKKMLKKMSKHGFISEDATAELRDMEASKYLSTTDISRRKAIDVMKKLQAKGAISGSKDPTYAIRDMERKKDQAIRARIRAQRARDRRQEYLDQRKQETGTNASHPAASGNSRSRGLSGSASPPSRAGSGSAASHPGVGGAFRPRF